MFVWFNALNCKVGTLEISITIIIINNAYMYQVCQLEYDPVCVKNDVSSQSHVSSFSSFFI